MPLRKKVRHIYEQLWEHGMFCKRLGTRSSKGGKGNKLLIDLRDLTSVARAKEQVFNLPLIIIPDAINLTRRMLEPLHKFHRLAADMMLPPGYSDNNNNNNNHGFSI